MLGDYAGQPYEATSLVECKNLEMEDLYKKSRDCTDDTILTCATAKVLLDSLNFGNERYFDKAYREYAKEYACPLGGYGAKFLAWVYTDTQAAIAGSIAGTYYQNFSNISNEIWESLKKNKYIKEIVDI